MYPTHIHRETVNINEYWGEEARMFSTAADHIRQIGLNVELTAIELYHAGRLYDHAAYCYNRAVAHTLGHKKSDRWDGHRVEMLKRRNEMWTRYVAVQKGDLPSYISDAISEAVG